MNNMTELIDRYVGVWHEPNVDARRSAIMMLWEEDGANFTRTIEAFGYNALEERITKAYEKWVRDGGFVFRSLPGAASHHNVAAFSWEMVPANGGAADTVGHEFFILGEEGQIRFDYQFPEPPQPTDELNRFLDLYVAVWNESDTVDRLQGIRSLWAEDGEFVIPATKARGSNAVEAAVTGTRHEFFESCSAFRCAGAECHHNVVRLTWRIISSTGDEITGAGADFLVLDENRRIRSAYRFADAPCERRILPVSIAG